MKKLIALLVAGSISCFFVAKAAGILQMNPITKIGSDYTYGFQTKTEFSTTKITTEEGVYRVFIASTYHGIGITAIKIK